MMVHNLLKKAILLTMLCTLVSGCATSSKVQVVQARDQSMSKQELLSEIEKLNTASREIDSKKGVTGTNVAAALFFWPGLVYTHMDAGEANQLIDQRRNYLTTLYNQKLAEEGKKNQKRS